jgi:hypothetical protein
LKYGRSPRKRQASHIPPDTFDAYHDDITPIVVYEETESNSAPEREHRDLARKFDDDESLFDELTPQLEEDSIPRHFIAGVFAAAGGMVETKANGAAHEEVETWGEVEIRENVKTKEKAETKEISKRQKKAETKETMDKEEEWERCGTTPEGTPPPETRPRTTATTASHRSPKAPVLAKESWNF